MVLRGTSISSLKVGIILFLSCLSLGLSAQVTVIENDQQFYEITSKVRIYEDVLGERDLEFIRQQESIRFQGIDQFEEFNKDYTYWGYFDIVNNDPLRSNWYLYFDRNDFIDVFYVDRNGGVTNLKAGFCYPASERQVRANAYYVLINSNTDETTRVYFRLKQDFHEHILNVSLQDTQHVASVQTAKNVLTFFLQGFLWIMIIYNFILFLGGRDKSYLYYSLYLFFISIFYLSIDGVFREFILPEFPLVSYLIVPVLIIVPVFHYGFLRSFLPLTKLRPGWDKILSMVMKADVALFVICLALFFILDDKWLIARFTQAIILVNVVVGLIFVYPLIKSKDILVKYILYAALCLVVGAVIDVILWDKVPVWGGASRVGLVGQILFFSLGLGKKISLLEQRKRRVQAKLLQKVRASQEQNQKQKEELEYMVRARTKELEKQKDQLMMARDQAQDAAKAKSDFLSVMSHEIRTPMNGVIGMTHLLLQEDPKHEQVENLKSLRLSAENLLLLLNDILDYNKLESGHIELENIDFSINELIRSIRYQFKSQAEEKGIKLNIQISSDIPEWMKGDPGRLSQVLTNLISNAIKFTSKGEVALQIRLQKIQNGTHFVEFRVKDSGIGIPREKLPVIFNRFTQASSDTSRKFGGTGLGLAITKRLLELYGSKIYLDSVLGEGSQFYFTLRLEEGVKKDIVEDQAAVDSMIERIKGLRILAVDDNQMNRLILEKFLKKWGIEYDSVEDGHRAISLVEKRTYDLILLDLQMPNISGFEVAEKIRSFDEKRHQEIPIIALSADIFANIYNKVIDSGIDDFVSKPFKPDELVSVIYRFAGKPEKQKKEESETN